MIDRVSSCVNCGLRPCHGCTEFELRCDECDTIADELFIVDGDQICRECAIEDYLSSLTKIDERNASDYE